MSPKSSNAISAVDKTRSDNPSRKTSSSGEPTIRKVPAVTRAIAILRLLGNSEEPLGVNKIARDLELVPSTALHILRVLMAEGLVRMDEATKRYELDLGILSITHRVLQRNKFIHAIQSSLSHLAEELGTTMLAVKTNGLDHMLVVAIASSSQPIRLHADLGTRFPSLVSATGRCVAAFGGYSEKEVRKKFNELQWEKPLVFSQWWKQVKETQQAGYGVDDGSFMPGVSVVAVPVIEHGQMTYSLVSIGLREQLSAMGIDNVARTIQEEAEKLLVGSL